MRGLNLIGGAHQIRGDQAKQSVSQAKQNNGSTQTQACTNTHTLKTSLHSNLPYPAYVLVSVPYREVMMACLVKESGVDEAGHHHPR